MVLWELGLVFIVLCELGLVFVVMCELRLVFVVLLQLGLVFVVLLQLGLVFVAWLELACAFVALPFRALLKLVLRQLSLALLKGRARVVFWRVPDNRVRVNPLLVWYIDALQVLLFDLLQVLCVLDDFSANVWPVVPLRASACVILLPPGTLADERACVCEA